MFGLRPAELIIILVVVLLLFGAKRLPDTARGLGRSLRIFKTEVKGMHDDEEPKSEPTAQPPRQIEGTSGTVDGTAEGTGQGRRDGTLPGHSEPERTDR